eukprot:g9841.t1
MSDGFDPNAGQQSPWSRSGGTRVDGDGENKASARNIPRPPLNLPKTPRKLGRRPPVKGHKRETLYDIARRVPLSIMREYFNFSLRQAADAMSISVTSLKRLCRRHGVKRWPHRQLSGLNRAVAHLEEKQQTSSDPSIAEQLHQLYTRRDVVIDHAFASDDSCSERRRDSLSRSDIEEGDMSLDSGHLETPEQDEAPLSPRQLGIPDKTTHWRQHEPDTTSPHHRQHQHQHTGDHDRRFDVVEGGGERVRVPGEYPTRGWARSSRSSDGSRDSSNAVSIGVGRTNFRASAAPPSPAMAFSPVNTPEQDQARRWPQSPLPRAGSAAGVTAAIARGRLNKGTGTNPNRPREEVASVPAHVASLPQQHRGGNVEPPTTKIAVVNALLLGGGPSDGSAARGSLSRTRSTPGGTHPRRRRCSEGPQGGGAGSGSGGGARGGPWGRREDDVCGPLPSIARLVEAGALLNRAGEGDWR